MDFYEIAKHYDEDCTCLECGDGITEIEGELFCSNELCKNACNFG